MEKQERGLINQWWGSAPSLNVAGEQGMEEEPLARYPGGLSSPQNTLQLLPSHLAWEPPGGQGSHLCWSLKCSTYPKQNINSN